MGSVALHAGCLCHPYQITSYADQTFSKLYWPICQVEYFKQVIFLVGGLLQRITGWMPLSSISDHVLCWSNLFQVIFADLPDRIFQTGHILGGGAIAADNRVDATVINIRSCLLLIKCSDQICWISPCQTIVIRTYLDDHPKMDNKKYWFCKSMRTPPVWEKCNHVKVQILS